MKGALPPVVRSVIVVLLLDMVCQSLVYPSLPALLRSLHGGTVAEGAQLYGLLTASYSLAELFSAPILGQLSDRYGRRPVLLLSTLGGAVSFLVAALAPSVALVFVGYAMAGLTSSMLVVVNAVVADATEPENRAGAFGMLGAAFGAGFVLGPVVGALVATWGLRAPFFVAAGLMVVAAVVVATRVPESLPVAARSKERLRGVWPWATLIPIRDFPLVRALAGSQVLNALAMQILISIWVIHGTYRFGLGIAENGWLLAAFGITMALSQALLVPRLVPKLGYGASIRTGFAVSAITYLGYGLAPSLAVFVIIMILGTIGAIDEPAQQAVIADAVPEDQRGAVQGSLATLGSLMGIVGPVAGTWIFTAGLPHLPGLPFLVGAGLVAVAGVLAHQTLRRFAVA